MLLLLVGATAVVVSGSEVAVEGDLHTGTRSVLYCTSDWRTGLEISRFLKLDRFNFAALLLLFLGNEEYLFAFASFSLP